jgi:DtxR family Mn-dependent transcriptional regulator
VLERWLVDELGFDWAAADLEAERIALTISDEVIRRIDVSMGTPATCPHGNAIPGRDPGYGVLESLATLDVATPARVRRISEVAEHEGQVLLQLLASHDIGEGCSVIVRSRNDATLAVEILAHDTVVALPEQAAGAIWVERELDATRRPETE